MEDAFLSVVEVDVRCTLWVLELLDTEVFAIRLVVVLVCEFVCN